MSWRDADAAKFIAFESEELAKAFVTRRFRHFCSSWVPEPELKDGTRPDFGFRLIGLRHIPLTLECKKFREHDGQMSDLCAGIAQAAHYAKVTHSISFVGPVSARSIMRLSWQAGPIGSAALVAGQFNVGILSFVTDVDRFADQTGAMLSVAGVPLATFSLRTGQPAWNFKSNIESLLRPKLRKGESTARAARRGNADGN